MNKLCTILVIILASVPVAAFAQTKVLHRSDTIGIKAEGREVLTIVPDQDGHRATISIAGFEIDLEGRGEKSRKPHRSHQKSSDEKPAPMPHTRRRYIYSNYNTITTEGFMFGFTSLSKPDYSMYEDGIGDFMDIDVGKSISFSFDVTANFSLTPTQRTCFSVGFRPRWNNYVFSDRITIEKIGGMVRPVELGEMGRYKKSKLTTFSLDVPVMIQFYPVKRLSLTGGIYGGMTLGDYTKVKFPKDKNRGDFGVNFFNAGAFARIKFYHVGVFVNYSFTPLFENGAGPKTRPITFGITF